MSKFFALSLLFVISVFDSSQAFALKVQGQMGAMIVTNILSFSPEDADAFCLDNPEFHNCDIVRQRQAEERQIIELNSDDIDNLQIVNFTTTTTINNNEGRFFRSINFE